MSGISTSINLQDRISGSLNRITASLYEATYAFQGVDRASETAFNASGVQAMTQELYAYEARIQGVESELMNANRKIEQMQNELDETKSKATALENAFSQIGSVIAGLGIGLLVKQQVSEAVDYASDLVEVQNVVDTVFGDNSAVNEWSQNTLEAFGLNELSAKQFAGTMGAMLSSSGIEEQAESMSMSLAELAGNMASFYNLDAEEAFNKIRSGISGETEPLKQLGINMSVANLEAYALANGIEVSYNEMDQASQTMLRYHYLMDATANAQGDFARTSGSYANQVKLLKENWTQFTGELATSALPILAYGISLLNDGVAFISENWTIIQPILMGLLAMRAAYTTALIIHKAIQLGAAIAEGIHAAATAAVSMSTVMATTSQSAFNAALLACPITWIILAIIALIAIIVALANWIAKTSGVAETGFGVIAGAVAVAGAAIWNTIVGLANFIIGIGVEIYNLIATFANFFANVFNDPVGAIINLFAGMFDFILGIVQSAAELIDTVLGTDMSGAVEGFRSSVSSAVDDIVGEQTVVMEKANASDYMLEGVDYADAWNAGVEWGDGAAKKLDDLTASLDTSSIDSAYTSTDVGSVADSLSGIKSDTNDIKDSVDITDENLKYLRDVAERDVINRFTTAEIKVDMQNTNNISSGMDIDGVVEQLTAGVQEAMSQAAEGVH